MFVCLVSFVQKLNLGNHNHGSHRLAKNIRNYRFMKKTTDSGMALNNRCLLNLFQVQVNLFQKHLFLDQLTHNQRYTDRVLQTIQMKLILLWVRAERAV